MISRRGEAAAELLRPEAVGFMADFYAKGEAPSARLEAEGWQYFTATDKPLCAFQANNNKSAWIGREGQRWIPCVSDENAQREGLERFAGLKEWLGQAAEARRAWQLVEQGGSGPEKARRLMAEFPAAEPIAGRFLTSVEEVGELARGQDDPGLLQHLVERLTDFEPSRPLAELALKMPDPTVHQAVLADPTLSSRDLLGRLAGKVEAETLRPLLDELATRPETEVLARLLPRVPKEDHKKLLELKTLDYELAEVKPETRQQIALDFLAQVQDQGEPGEAARMCGRILEAAGPGVTKKVMEQFDLYQKMNQAALRIGYALSQKLPASALGPVWETMGSRPEWTETASLGRSAWEIVSPESQPIVMRGLLRGLMNGQGGHALGTSMLSEGITRREDREALSAYLMGRMKADPAAREVSEAAMRLPISSIISELALAQATSGRNVFLASVAERVHDLATLETIGQQLEDQPELATRWKDLVLPLDDAALRGLVGKTVLLHPEHDVEQLTAEVFRAGQTSFKNCEEFGKMMLPRLQGPLYDFARQHLERESSSRSMVALFTSDLKADPFTRGLQFLTQASDRVSAGREFLSMPALAELPGMEKALEGARNRLDLSNFASEFEELGKLHRATEEVLVLKQEGPAQGISEERGRLVVGGVTLRRRSPS